MANKPKVWKKIKGKVKEMKKKISLVGKNPTKSKVGVKRVNGKKVKGK